MGAGSQGVLGTTGGGIFPSPCWKAGEGFKAGVNAVRAALQTRHGATVRVEPGEEVNRDGKEPGGSV